MRRLSRTLRRLYWPSQLFQTAAKRLYSSHSGDDLPYLFKYLMRLPTKAGLGMQIAFQVSEQLGDHFATENAGAEPSADDRCRTAH
jgi:hypothetical protein